MTYYDVFVAHDDDTFKWEDGNWNGNYPRKRGPWFPSKAPFWELVDKIQSGKYEGKQLDWGSWGAKVTKDQAVDFIQEYYDDNWMQSNVQLPHLLGQLEEVYDHVLGLDPQGAYVLVALET
jgi:hypothetical protein